MAGARRRLRRTPMALQTTMAMIDVIFILFAFFLSVSQIRKSTVKVNLPEVSDAVATGDREPESEVTRFVIHLTADGRLAFGRESFRTREAFFARVRAAAEAERAAGRTIVAEIIPDRDARMGPGVDLLNFLTRQGVRRVDFLAVEKGK